MTRPGAHGYNTLAADESGNLLEPGFPVERET